MEILTNREAEIFDCAYRLGFRAGQLDWRQHIIDGHYRMRAEVVGTQIAVQRDNISLEEYSRQAEGVFTTGGENE